MARPYSIRAAICYIAFTGCSMDDCDAYVADWDAQSVYVLPRAHPDHGVEVIGLSETEVFIADSSPDVRGTGYFDTLVRYDLSELATSGARL